jgi:hypothetical protein
VRKLAIIIPVLGRLELLENSLVSVLQNQPEDSEVLVVLNRPYDDPYDLEDEVRFLQARRGASLVDCLNLGIAESQAPIVHLLACGVEATEGWTTSALRHLRDPQVAAVAPLVLTSEEPRRMVAAGIGYSRGGSRRLTGHGRPEGTLGPWTSQMIGPSLLAGFYRKSAVETAGGFDRSLGRAADVDLALRLRALGHRVLLDPQSKVHAPAACYKDHAGLRAGLEAERLFLKHVPEGRWIGALAAHGLTVAADFFRALPHPACLTQLIGRAVAWTAFSSQRRRHRELMQLIGAAQPAAHKPAGSAIPRPHIGVFAAQRAARDAA